MHAIDSMTFSSRAFPAAINLIPQTRDINAVTTGARPRGYTALLFACDGGDIARNKVRVVRSLLRYTADIEAVTPKGMSPLLLACSTGAADVAQFLIEHGARKLATNVRGQGARQLGASVSGSVRHFCDMSGIPMTEGQGGRTRHHVSQARQMRYWQQVPRQPRDQDRASSAASASGAGEPHERTGRRGQGI